MITEVEEVFDIPATNKNHVLNKLHQVLSTERKKGIAFVSTKYTHTYIYREKETFVERGLVLV